MIMSKLLEHIIIIIVFVIILFDTSNQNKQHMYAFISLFVLLNFVLFCVSLFGCVDKCLVVL